MRQLCALILLACALYAGSARAKDITFHATDGGFSIELPPGWIKIPNQAIRNTATIVESKYPKSRPVNAVYAFQYGYAGTWFRYPYIMVQVDRFGRPSEAAMRRAARHTYPDISKRLMKIFPDMADANVGQPMYDEKTNTIWIYAKVRAAGVGMLSGVTVMIPTSYGFVKISELTKAGMFNSLLPSFANIVRSFEPDTSTRY